MLVSISVFIKGDNLVPGEITAALGVEPTESQTRGDIWTSPRGKTYVRDTGVWIWGTKEDSETATIADGVNKLAGQFGSVAERFSTLPGVEFSWLDVFICGESSEGGSQEVKFTLTTETLSQLSEIGLPVEITVGTVAPD